MRDSGRSTDMREAEIKRAVLAALHADSHLSSQPIEVSIDRGRVTLEGRVQSFRRKLLAQRTAEGAAGGAAVDNRLQVSAPENPSDDDVAGRVRELIEQDGRLLDQAIVVEVRAGRVTLSGSVVSEQERTLASDVALQAPGARHVANHLVIEPAAQSEAVVVGQELALALSDVPELEGCELHVAVSGDVALLSGTVRTPAQIRIATDLVRQVWVGEIRPDVALLP
jgi:osmotically-inducible protein OsmY